MKFFIASVCTIVSFVIHSQPSEAYERSELQLEIRADLKKMISKERVLDEELGADFDAKPSEVDGILKDLAQPNRVFKMKIRARGNTSLAQGEADFPKLRVSIDKNEKLDGSVFDGNRNFRINTHLSDKKKMTGMGRIAGENAPLREHLAYRIADVIGLATPQARLARIKYVDMTTNQVLERNALLLETTKSTGKRLKGEEIDEQALTMEEHTRIDPVLGAKFFLFHQIIGNNDVQLRVNQQPTMTTEANRHIWNSFVFELADGSRVPVVYDLDLASLVNGRLANNRKTLPQFGLTAPGSEDLAKRIAPLFEKFTKSHLQDAAKQIESKKSALYELVAKIRIDEIGRSLARQRLDTYFSSIETILATPVIAATDVRFFNNAKLSVDKLRENQMAADGIGTLRKGTPVRILERSGGVLKVEIIPLKNDLKEKESAIGYILATTPIRHSLSEEQIRIFDERDMSLAH